MQSLDNPFWHALRGPTAFLAQGDDQAVRFDPAVNIFGALPDDPTAASWRALAKLVGPGGRTVLCRTTSDVPDGWSVQRRFPSVQFVAPSGIGSSGSDVVELTTDDVPEMMQLADSTNPGPFLARTIEQGDFIGVREQGALIAMAGLRSRLPGACEISSVCTDPASRGRGLAARLLLHLVDRVQGQGRQVFLHAAVDNEPALRLYRRLGFEARAQPVFFGVQAPG